MKDKRSNICYYEEMKRIEERETFMPAFSVKEEKSHDVESGND